MKIRLWGYLLVSLALFALLGGGLWLGAQLELGRPTAVPPPVAARVLPLAATHAATGIDPIPQVVVGTPEYYTKTAPTRYTYRNEYPADRTKWQTLYLLDIQTGQETRLGDDSHSAVFGTMNDDYLLWYFKANLHAYHLATGQDTLIAKRASDSVHPQISDNWVAFGAEQGYQNGNLYAANLQTHAIITLTHDLGTRGDWDLSAYFGISPFLAAWYERPQTIVVYDLQRQQVITRLVDVDTVFKQKYIPIFGLSPGETIVTWGRSYGYDLVTHSFFRIHQLVPPNWDNAPIVDVGRIHESNRILDWSIQMQDGTERFIKAPLIDATPSAVPCSEGQNLVQNGNLEDIAAHNLWQQKGSSSDLIVNDLPPNAPQAGQWAIRLGRYSNSQQTIQQTLNIPSNVKRITLAFDVRASSWDIWGGDQLQVDLIDPMTNQSVLATPIEWTNRQLANGGWMPLQVDIQDWPGIDTPLQLVFRATTDWAFPTDFTLDNIRFTTACQ